MNLIDRYIARTLLAAVGLVMAVLMMLGLLFTFIAQQGDVGIGHFTMLDALEFSALSLPQFALQAFPAGALIGALLGIGVLARSNEITVMRASGMSKLRLAASVLISALLLVIAALLIGELLQQPLAQLADQNKAFAKYSNVSFAGDSGAWIRDGDLILNVRARTSAAQYGGLLIIDLTPDGRVAAIGRAAHGVPAGKQNWQLTDYAESRFDGDSVSSLRTPSRQLHTAAGGELVQLAGADPGELSLHTLYSAMRYQRSNAREYRDYQFAFWAQVARTTGIFAALLFALPFGFGSLRAASLSGRTTLGLVLGLVYFFLQRLVESGTAVFNWNPLLLAWMPTALLALATGVLLWRTR